MEFILENPFILFVIFAIISSLFKSGKGKTQNQNQKNTSPQAKQSGARTIQKQQTQSRSMDHRKPMSPVKRLEQMATEMAERLEKEYTEKRKLADSTMRQARDYTPPIEEVKSLPVEVAQPIVKQVVVEAKQQAPQPSLSIEKQKVTDGVVWAEILGPPRALNPHRTLRRK